MAENIRKISVSQPTVTEEDKAAVLDCLDKTFLSGDSPVVGEFESNFSNTVGRNYGIAVANGSVALDVVLHALDLQPGDEVILPSFTIASCLFAILRTGANKGTKCGCKVIQDNICKRHYNLKHHIIITEK